MNWSRTFLLAKLAISTTSTSLRQLSTPLLPFRRAFRQPVGLDSHREDCLLPLVDCGELVDVDVELGEGGVEVRGLFAEQGDKDGGIVVEGIRSHVVERFPKVLVGPRCFPEPEHSVLNGDPIVVLQGVEPESAHLAEAIEVDGFELILEDTYNFLLQDACKSKSDDRDFRENLTGDIILLCRRHPSLGPCGGWGRRHCCCNASLKLPYHQLPPEPCFHSRSRQFRFELAEGEVKEELVLLLRHWWHIRCLDLNRYRRVGCGGGNAGIRVLLWGHCG